MLSITREGSFYRSACQHYWEPWVFVHL